MEQVRVCPPTIRRPTVWALYAAIAMPLIYFGTQLIAAPFYPGHSFAQDTASMLGTTTSRQPWIFNWGAVLTGVAGLIGEFGLFRTLRTVTWTALARLVGLCVVANGVLSVKLAEGTMQRLFALVVFVPVGVAAYALVRRVVASGRVGNKGYAHAYRA